MVAIAVVLTLLLCLLADWWIQRRERQIRIPATQAPFRGASAPVLLPPLHVGGFRFQTEMSYHPGHAWVFVEGPDRVRVGVDDFACRLLGEVERVDLPPVGLRVRQGRPAWTLLRNGRRAPMLSPISGRIVELNPRVQTEPALVRNDPYGEGWLFAVRADDLQSDLNNLLEGPLARRWLEEAGVRLSARLREGIEISFADGGTAIPDIGSLIAEAEWMEVVREFLKTEA